MKRIPTPIPANGLVNAIQTAKIPMNMKYKIAGALAAWLPKISSDYTTDVRLTGCAFRSA